MSYAKRFALCNALNIVIEGIDDDARNKGDLTPITKEEAAELQQKCEEYGVRMKEFKDFFHIARLEDMPASQLDRAHAMVDRKKKA